MNPRWEAVIGLEIHVQLATRSKLFSGAATAFGAAPNTQACAVDLALPGVLPVLNEAAVRMAIMFGLAIDGEIAPRSVFARKSYFYPDLPKGYQISQFELPIVARGTISIPLPDGGTRSVRVTRAHLEEDAGKSMHDGMSGCSGIDLNRAGTPLIEVVSEPDMRSALEAVAYMRHVHALVRYLGISDGNMQEGSFRCDANVSLRPLGEERLGTRTETKNLNSFRFVELAIEYEIARQQELLERGEKIRQETRLYDSDLNETRPLRSKEEAFDYRYFPDPDLLPVEIQPQWIEDIRRQLPELPHARCERLQHQYSLPKSDAALLTADRALADFFEETAGFPGVDARIAANWIIGELGGALNRFQLELGNSPVGPERLAGLLRRIADHTISGRIAKQVFETMWSGNAGADEIIAAQGLQQVTDAGLIEKLVLEVLAANTDQVEKYRAGKEKVLAFLVGQVMKLSDGKANPRQVSQVLLARLRGRS
ncbi:MAG: Asp-tRNA(Asn)/Glu-tRNA(Gln) amidotransferase subunit GatB [Gammaproteobacteria bacterium]|nr:Asp-tRNA(Asn)/Glu-tRNA(Gln) amidotransferase subunit GatB [Gammaproteobacteria bacterium]